MKEYDINEVIRLRDQEKLQWKQIEEIIGVNSETLRKVYKRTKEGNLCVKCQHEKQRKVNRPSREELKDLIRNKSFVSIGQMFGVTNKSIEKWCIYYNLPSKKLKIKEISDEDWLKI